MPALTLDVVQFKNAGIAGVAEDSAFSSTPATRRIALTNLPAMVLDGTDSKAVAAFADCALVLFTIVAPERPIVFSDGNLGPCRRRTPRGESTDQKPSSTAKSRPRSFRCHASRSALGVRRRLTLEKKKEREPCSHARLHF